MHEVVALGRAEGVDLEELLRSAEDVAKLLGYLEELLVVGERAAYDEVACVLPDDQVTYIVLITYLCTAVYGRTALSALVWS